MIFLAITTIFQHLHSCLLCVHSHWGSGIWRERGGGGKEKRACGGRCRVGQGQSTRAACGGRTGNFFGHPKSCSILTFVNCYHTLHTLKVLNLNSGQAGGWKSSYSPWGYRDLQRDVKPCPSQSMSN